MPAAPVHHTPIDSTNAWDGPAATRDFDKVKGDFVKFYAWVDEGEVDGDADGTDKEDGWGPHHDVDSTGKPGDANLKGVQAAMAALNGAHGGNSVVPDGDRQGVWDHLAAHYKDAGVKAADIPELKSASAKGTTRDAAPVAPGDVTSDPLAAPDAGELPIYMPVPYRVDADEDVTCPHCQLKNDTDATFCDQCGTELAGRDDVKVGGELTGDADMGTGYEPESYDPQADENVQCPDCEKRNDPDARFCDQCGAVLMGRTDVNVDGPAEDIDDVDDQAGNAVLLNESQAAEATSADYVANDGSRSELTENLVRFRSSGPAAPAVLLRDDGSAQSGSTMFGYFSTFNDWYEIDSYWEGTFLERVAPGAYQKTMTEDRAGMRVLYDHGFDPQLGNKPLGPIDILQEDSIGAFYQVPLLDTDYNRNFVLPALRGQLMNGQAVGSQLGASFRFIVTGESWDYSGDRTSFNPEGLPLRTITSTQVLEFGPVTFPANDLATSGVRSATRSTTDALFSRLRNDPLSLARFTERTSSKVVERILALPPSTTRRSAGNTTQSTTDDVLAAARTRSFNLRARLELAES